MPQDVIVAVYETRARAAEAAQELRRAGIAEGAIHQFDEEHPGWSGGPAAASTTTTPGMAPQRGFWGSLFGMDESSPAEHSLFDQTVQRGGTVLSVTAEPADQARVMEILERYDPIDIDDRTTQVGESGTGAAAAGGTERGATTAELTGGAASALNESTTRQAAATGTEASLGGAGQGEQVIALAKEEVQIGKRIVETGRMRIRRYVVETPIEERVRLRTERVVIERRRPISGTELSPDAFTESVTEVTERTEMPVVEKTVRVGEEVVVRTDENVREETVRDTVRRQDVEVTRDGEPTPTRGTTATGTPPSTERT